MSTLSNAHTVRVAEAFNGVARSFETMLENDITRGIRRTVYAILETLVEPGSTILDINCGIGIDAVELAKKGYRVAGADLSPNMIQQAQLRAAQHGAQLEFIETTFEDLSP
ncbi:MAG TPA: methyltransferase domain-containing protein, partial [Bacteroidota bacterium]